ncbi:hypothetical protein RF11_06658 [Thelohanellus kitauei]|uniref:Uncharacterized protein n=1 Tax=Thelohanellus kitauei TaxID=669202 RepID=A0A0C2J6I2_THEKT|nr:hypothetical protein RF11_06658 [Thelohanellus kitauei]
MKDGVVIGDRMVMNYVPHAYPPNRSVLNPKLHELFNVPDHDQDRLLFMNGHPGTPLDHRKMLPSEHTTEIGSIQSTYTPVLSSFDDLDKFTYFYFSENDIYPK